MKKLFLKRNYGAVVVIDRNSSVLLGSLVHPRECGVLLSCIKGRHFGGVLTVNRMKKPFPKENLLTRSLTLISDGNELCCGELSLETANGLLSVFFFKEILSKYCRLSSIFIVLKQLWWQHAVECGAYCRWSHYSCF